MTSWNFDQRAGVTECPRCRFTLEPLRDRVAVCENGGYLLDYGTGWDPDDSIMTSALLGDVRRYLWRHFITPLAWQTMYRLRRWWHARMLRRYPHSLICTHCGHLECVRAERRT